MKPPIRLAVAPVLAAVVLVLGAVNAAAFTSGSSGYDIGYLQCNTAYPSGAFGIVGVDSGWPFISSLHPGNPCLASEYAHSDRKSTRLNSSHVANSYA